MIKSSISGAKLLPILMGCILITGFFFRPLWEDEVEHLHASYLVWSGEVPYRDFFQNHPPTLHLILSPFISLFPSGVACIFTSRCIVSMILVLSWFLLKNLISEGHRYLFSICSFSVPVYWLLYHMRPDPFMFFFISLHLFTIKKWFSDSRLKYLAVSGIALGAATAFLPKSILLIAGLPLILMIDTRFREKRFQTMILFLSSVTCVPACLFSYLLTKGITTEFYFYVFALNAETLSYSACTAKLKTIACNFPILTIWLSGLILRVRPAGRVIRTPFQNLVKVYGVLSMINYLMTPFGWQYNLAAWVMFTGLDAGIVWDCLKSRFSAFQRIYVPYVAAALIVAPFSVNVVIDVARWRESIWRMEQLELLTALTSKKDTVFAIAPLHPIFAGDAGSIYHPWQFHFAGNERIKKTWFDGFCEKLSTGSPVVVDAGYLTAVTELTNDPDKEISCLQEYLTGSHYREKIFKQRRYFLTQSK